MECWGHHGQDGGWVRKCKVLVREHSKRTAPLIRMRLGSDDQLLALTAQVAPARPEHPAGGQLCIDPASSISLFTATILINSLYRGTCSNMYFTPCGITIIPM